MAHALQQQVNLSRRACATSDADDHVAAPTAAKTRSLSLEIGGTIDDVVCFANGAAAQPPLAGTGCDRQYGLVNENFSQFTSENVANNLSDTCSYDDHDHVDDVVSDSSNFPITATCNWWQTVKTNCLHGGANRFRFGNGGGNRSVRRSLMIYALWIGVLLVANNGMVMARPNLSATNDGLTTFLSPESPFASLIEPASVHNKRSAEPPTTDVPGKEVTHASLPSDLEIHAGKKIEVITVEFGRVETPFIIGIWILFASIAKIGFHMTPKLSTVFPESCLLIVIGVIIGFILLFLQQNISPLTPNTFFLYMLPPIIFDAGYFMPNRLFFDNLGTILLMAVVGTIFNIATIGGALYACGLTGIFQVETPLLDLFLFASLIAAVDPVAVLAVFEEIHVNEILYIVVFGESLLNDAVTVVLYHMFEAYNEIGVENIVVGDIFSGLASFLVVALGGTIIGVIWGFLTGLVTRYTDHVRVIEPIFIFVMAYLAYLNAEIFHMSGILAITFCGITMKNYVEANISHKSHTTIKYALKMIASSSETIIFMFLGVATVNNRHAWNTWFILLTILFCSVFRTIGVLLLTAMANRFRIHKLTKVDQFVMSYGGLRGAIAFALVLLIDPHHVPLQPMFATTTIAVIYFTVFLQGITIKPLVKILNVKRASKRKPTMNERIHERFMDHLMAGVEDIVGKTGNYNVRDKFKRFDNRFIRPYLIRDLKGAEPKILETYSKLTMRDAMDFMRRNPSTIGQMSGTESMSALFRNYTGYFGGSPSFSNLENSTRNLDMQELDYNPSKKDLTDARIHHLLAEELKPYRRHRRLSYSRHAVDDRDLTTQQVNYKMHMNIRRMVGERKHHKRSKRGKENSSGKTNHVSFPEFQQNGSAKQFANDYINDVLHEANEDNEVPQVSSANDDWDSGLTFTAKATPESSKSADRANNNSLIAHITSLPGFDPTKARIVKHYSNKSCSDKDTLEIIPTAAETLLPWRRDRSYQSIVDEGNKSPEARKRLSRDSEAGEVRVSTPTAIESVLPWKRGDEEDEENNAVKQNEFPSWASNKEYLAYNSPSATFLGGLTKPKQAKSVIGLFRRESSGSASPQLDPDIQMTGIPTPIGRASADRRSASIAGGMISDENSHSGIFPVTASHRRNTRRGSMLEITGVPIPEENYTKSLPGERDRWRGERRGPPLLRQMTTPKPTNRRLNPQIKALLSGSSTDSDEYEDEARPT